MSRRTTQQLLAALVAWTLVACGWFASTEPRRGRYWDERYGVANLHRVLVEGTLRPENGWYGRLSYLPQAALLGATQSLHRLTGIDRLAVFRDDDGGDLSPTGYFVARGLNVVYGAGSLILAFLVGRRLFGPEVALVATLLLASTPWLLRHLVTFKPDVLAVLLVLLTFYWCLDAAETGSRRDFLLAGLGIGLAASAKYTGALVAIPVAVTGWLALDRWRLVLERLALAGATSIGTFLILHPDLGFYLRFLAQQDSFYAAQGSHSFGAMLLSELGTLLHWSFHGAWLGVAALSGFVLLCWQLARRLRADPAGPEVRQLASFLSFPLGFSVVYGLSTGWPKGNNYLVIVPFTALAAAWLLHEIWKRLAARLPVPARRPALGLMLAGLLLVEVWPANAYIYSQAVSTTTLDLAAQRIRHAAPPIEQRIAVFEAGQGTLHVVSRGPSRYRVLRAYSVEALTEWPDTALDLADFEIFTEDRLQGPQRHRYEQRLRRFGPQAAEYLRPAWFRVSGPTRVLLVHPWKALPRPQAVEWVRAHRRRDLLVGRLPDGLTPGQPVSLEVRIARGAKAPAEVRVGEVAQPLLRTGWDTESTRYSTSRFLLPDGHRRIELEWNEPDAGSRPRIAVVRWRQP